MTDVEDRLRRGLQAFADETTANLTSPAVASIALRAQQPPRRRSPRAKVAVAIVVGAMLVTGAAAAVGVLPGPVESKLREFRSWGFDTSQGATRMARTTAGDMTYEVWRAPNTNGGQCVYDRVIAPNGDVDHGGAAQCWPTNPSSSPNQFRSLGFPESVGEHQCGKKTWGTNRCLGVASGQLPVGSVAVVFEFDDGTTLTVEGQEEGFFITTFPGVRDGARIVAIRSLSADGRVTATALGPTG